MWKERSIKIRNTLDGFVFPQYQFNAKTNDVKLDNTKGICTKSVSELFTMILIDCKVFDLTKKVPSHIMRKTGALLYHVYSKRRMSPALIRSFACWS